MNKIISGGQTGVDQAALDWAEYFGYQRGGWCPKGRLSEYGKIDAKYPLTECASEYYQVRTEMNIETSHVTFIISPSETYIGKGTVLTERLCKKHRQRYFCFYADQFDEYQFTDAATSCYNVDIINVAGPRHSSWPEGDVWTWRFLNEVFMPKSETGKLDLSEELHEGLLDLTPEEYLSQYWPNYVKCGMPHEQLVAEFEKYFPTEVEMHSKVGESRDQEELG